MGPYTPYNPTVQSVFAPQAGNLTAGPDASIANNDPSQFGEYSDWAAKNMADGMTADQLHQHLAENGVTDYGNGLGNPLTGGSDQQAQQPQHSGNWLTHLLPTIGGIGGGILGGIASLGMGGEVAGAAGGAGLGKALENALEGKKVIQGDDLTAAAEGGIGQGLGGLAGKVIGGVGGALASKGTKMATDAATKEGIDAVAQAYGDVPKPLQSLYSADNSLSHVKSLGYDPADPQNLVHVGTTSNDVLNEALNSSLAKTGPVNLSNYNGIVRGALAETDPNGALLGSLEGRPLARGGYGAPNTPAAKLVGQLNDLGAGVATKASDPNELRTLVDNLTGLQQKLVPKVNTATGAFDPADEAAYNLVNNVRNRVASALYDRPDVNAALTGQVGNLTAEDVGGSQALADHLNEVLTSAGKNGNSAAQDFLNAIDQNNNISALGNEGLKAGQIVTSSTAKARQAAQAGVDAGSSTNPLATATSGVMAGHSLLSGIGSHGIVPAVMGVGKAASHVANNPELVGVLGRIGDVLSKGAPAGGVVLATSPNMAPAPGGTGGNMNNQNGGQMNYQAGPMSQLWTQLLEQERVAPTVMGPSLAGVLGQMAPAMQRQSMVGSELSALPSAYGNAGGAQGLGGILSQISGLIPGTAAHTYQAQRGAAAQALGQQLGISPAAASGLLPGLMQNDQSAGLNQSILGSLSGQLAY